MKILTVADIHYPFCEFELEAMQAANETCDACFLLGDICGSDLAAVKRIASLPKIGVIGNHDDFNTLDCAGIPNAHGKVCEIAGVKVAGIYGSPRYSSANRPFLTQGECFKVIENLRKQGSCDILISHSGPFCRGANMAHQGFHAIDHYIRRARPRYVIHGHDHEERRKTRRFLVPVSGRRETEIICTFRVQIHDLKL